MSDRDEKRTEAEIVRDLTLEGVPTVDTKTPTALIPKTMTIMSLERFMDGPQRIRGCYDTRDLFEYACYANGCDNPVVFVNDERMEAVAFVDFGDEETPLHCDHRAILRLRRLACFNVLNEVHEKRQNQREMMDFVADWRHHIIDLMDVEGEAAGATDAEIRSALASIRSLTIDQVSSADYEASDLSEKRSAMEQVSASSKHKIPAGFIFRCQTYKDLMERDIAVRLSVLPTGDTPGFRLRIDGAEDLQENLAQEFRGRLVDELDDGTRIHIGSFSSEQ